MYTVFNTAPRIGSVNITNIDLGYVRDVVLDQVARYAEYRYQTPGYIKSDHLLLKILNSINVEFDGDLLSYQNKVAAQVNRLTGSMGMCNSAHHGRVFDKGVFYGDDVSEVIVTVSDTVAPKTLWSNWENMPAVRVLSHPIRNATVLELDGDLKAPADSKLGNIAVIELNIPLMACQFQIWKLANRTRSARGEAIPDAYFVSQVILPNMLLSHLDIAVLNTISYMAGMGGTFEVKTNLPFYLTDVSGRFDKGLEDIIKRFVVQTTTFNDILLNIPCFGKESLLEAIRMPEVAYTNQVIWALTIARLPLIGFLLRINAENGNAKNDMFINRFRRSLIEAASGKYLVNQLPTDVVDRVQQYVEMYLLPYLKEI